MPHTRKISRAYPMVFTYWRPIKSWRTEAGMCPWFFGTLPVTETSYCKVLSVPFACVGSGDPVRVLHLYTTNTLDTLWSIYCWGICTTCHYQFYCAMLKPYALRLPTAMCVWVWLCLSVTAHRTVLWGALYTACVDASRMVFWDCSVLR